MMKTNNRNRYTDDDLIEDAKKYNYRSDWQKNSLSLYNAARYRKILEICCAHMQYKNNCYGNDIGIIYAFIFEDNTVYIGLTITPDRRYSTHVTKSGIIFNKINDGVKFKYEIIESNISNNLLSIKEQECIEFYKNKGFILLNKAKGGSRGSIHEYWSVVKIKQKALQFNTRNEWAKTHPTTYYAAKRKKIFKDCCSHMMTIKKTEWLEYEIIEDAKKYETKKEWMKNNKSAYNRALKLNILEKCTRHMKKDYYKNWTRESIVESSKKYDSISRWIKDDPNAYSSAIRFGILDICTEHMNRIHKKWNSENIEISAKTYTSKTEWFKNEQQAYCAAKRMGIFDRCCEHMK